MSTQNDDEIVDGADEGDYYVVKNVADPVNEIVPGLWISGYLSVTNADFLKANNIKGILSVMRNAPKPPAGVVQYTIPIDDKESEDALQHFLPAIDFIQKQVDKGHGVLIHCMAGMSRSAAFAAAYLMYSRSIDLQAAIDLLVAARPIVHPNDAFLLQLQIFYQAAFKVSHRDKNTRMFYLQRTLEEVLNGDGATLDSAMFAKFPRTPILESPPPVPTVPIPRRRIRCKMCRHELATREHMLDHGQLGPPTPAVGSRRSSEVHHPDTRRSSFTGPHSRRGSEASSSRQGSTSDSRPVLPFAVNAKLMESLSMSALDTTEDDEIEVTELPSTPLSRRSSARRNSTSRTRGNSTGIAAMTSIDGNDHAPEAAKQSSGNDLANQLPNSLTALRAQSPTASTRKLLPIAPPILVNPKCSGYFVEPMKWMEPVLENGDMAGKIICPNKKCGVKLGNYDWAGVCCGCREWVTPGFCIARSKVDEVS